MCRGIVTGRNFATFQQSRERNKEAGLVTWRGMIRKSGLPVIAGFVQMKRAFHVHKKLAV
jgi:hypothetical protein